MRRLGLVLFLGLLLCGCGSLNSPNAGGLANPTASPNGTVYALTTNTDMSSQIQVYHGLNGSSPGVSGVASIPLPQALGLSLSVNRAIDTLYVGCAGSGTPVLLVYNFASQLNGTAATPNSTVPLTSLPLTQSYDPVHDVLYLGSPNGVVTRLSNVSQVTNPTPIGLTTPQGNIAQLLSVLADGSSDRLITLSSSDPAAALTSLPVFNNASGSLTSAGALNPPGLVSPLSVRAGDNSRLLVLDLGGPPVNTATPSRVQRYESANNYGGAATLSLSVPNADCIAYDQTENRLYAGLKTGTIQVFDDASNLNGSPNVNPSLTLPTNPVAPVNDLAIDATH